MLTTPSTFKTDPRVMCGLIASTSLKLMGQGSVASTQNQVIEATLLRLLDIYKFDAFHHGKRRGILTRTPFDTPALNQHSDSNEQLKRALQMVHRRMHPRLSKQDFCELVSDHVRACFGMMNLSNRERNQHKAQLRRFLILLRDGLPQ
jgi:hypothetical protein